MTVREAVGDIAGICERKPDVCETGKSALHTIGVRAKASAKIAYDMLDNGEPDQSIKTGTVAKDAVANLIAKAEMAARIDFSVLQPEARRAAGWQPSLARGASLFRSAPPIFP